MTAAAPTRRVPLELSGDGRFRRRVVRLSIVSAVALGVLTGLVVATLEAPAALVGVFVAGWILMPAMLVASLRSPRLRYGLVVPASLVSLGLVAVVLGWLPATPLGAAGWVLMLAGVALGGGLGLWFWYRVIPVPGALDDPFAPGRWALVGLHVGLVVIGITVVALAAEA
jgi:hypothetical protein